MFFIGLTLSLLCDHKSVLHRCILDIVCHEVDLRPITGGPELLLRIHPKHGPSNGVRYE